MLAAGDTRTCVNKLTIDGPAPIVPRLPDGLDFVRRECRVVSSGNSVTGCSVSSWSAHRVQRVARGSGNPQSTSPNALKRLGRLKPAMNEPGEFLHFEIGTIESKDRVPADELRNQRPGDRQPLDALDPRVVIDGSRLVHDALDARERIERQRYLTAHDIPIQPPVPATERRQGYGRDATVMNHTDQIPIRDVKDGVVPQVAPDAGSQPRQPPSPLPPCRRRNEPGARPRRPHAAHRQETDGRLPDPPVVRRPRAVPS